MEGCEWREQSTRLNYQYITSSAALTVEDGKKALICFDINAKSKRCEVFSGTSSTPTHTAKFPHDGGKLAFYRGRPTTVGDHSYNDGRKVETLKSSGWSPLADFPKYLKIVH